MSLPIPGTLPPGHVAVPLDSDPAPYHLPMCLVIRQDDLRAPRPVELPAAADARAWLGCVLDGFGGIHEWVEIWVQDRARFTEKLPPEIPPPRTLEIDQRWERFVSQLRQASGSLVLGSLGPDDCLVPLYLDPVALRVCRLALPEAGTAPWHLCRDDDLLRRHGLPAYSASSTRYLVNRASDPARFVKVDCLPPTAADESLGTIQPPPAEWLQINPQAAPLMIRAHVPLDYEDYLELLQGGSLADLGSRLPEAVRHILRSQLAALAGQDTPGRGLFLGGPSPRTGRDLEVFYLKLRIWLQAVRAAHGWLLAQETPLLNLDPGSFGVTLVPEAQLPWLWTARCHLLRPGRVVAVQLPGQSRPCHLAVGEESPSPYREAHLAEPFPFQGSGNLLLRRFESINGNDVVLEVSLDHPVEQPPPRPADILQARLHLSGREPFEFFGSLVSVAEPRTANRPGRFRDVVFRSWPKPFPPGLADHLDRRKEGTKFPCFYRFIRNASAALDGHSLAMLGLRTLVVHSRNSLALAKEEWDELGEAVETAFKADPDAPLARAVARALRDDARLRERFGAQHVAPGPAGDGPDQSARVPEELWAEALGVALRLQPGIGGISVCDNFEDSPIGGCPGLLGGSIATLERLLVRTRSLLLPVGSSRQELLAVVERLRRR